MKVWIPNEKDHNPGVRLIKFDRQSNRQLDILQYYVDLPTANRKRRVYLKTGYSAIDMYEIPDIMPEALSKLIDKFEDPTGAYFKDYLNWYNTNSTDAMPCDLTCHKAVMCGLRNFRKREFSRCFPRDWEPKVIGASFWENLIFAYAKTKPQISCAVTAQLISAFVFATWIVQSLYFLNSKFPASSHPLWLHSLVCVWPGRKHRRPVFSERGSIWFFLCIMLTRLWICFCDLNSLEIQILLNTEILGILQYLIISIYIDRDT